MDCARIRQDALIEIYLSHRLDEPASDELETHLLGCQDCSRLLEELQSLRDELQERADTLRTVPAKRTSIFFWWQTATATAIAVILAATIRFHYLSKAKREGIAQVAAPKSPSPESPSDVQAKMAAASQEIKKLLEQQKTRDSDKNAAVHGQAHSAPAAYSPRPPQRKATEIAKSEEESPVEPGRKPDESNLQEVVTNPPGAPTSVDGTTANETRDYLPTGPGPKVKLTSAQGVELYRIGAVEAPPFTFAGFGLHALNPKGPKTNAEKQGQITPDTGRVLFGKGMNAYSEARYGDAIGFLVSAAHQDKKTDDINFYLGICQIIVGHPSEAEVPLQNVVALGNSVYLQPAHYYLGKTYTQLMMLDKAEAEFRVAANLPGRLTSDAKALVYRVAALRTELDSK
jgi:hypothetical protein